MRAYLQQFAPVIGVAFLLTVVATPFCQRLSFRIGAVQAPDARRVHTRPTALLGGAAILVGFLGALAVAWQLDRFNAVFDAGTVPLGIALGAVVMFAVGQLDDLRDVSPPAKLAGTVLAGSVLSIAGVSILFFRIPFGGLLSLSPDVSALLTVLWVVGMTTAINYIDGLDGLAAGVVGIAAGAILMFAEHLDNDGEIIADDNIGALIAACVVGACLGYLPWNFHPAKIFMGDAGALTLGLLMAASTIAIGGNTDAEVGGQTFFFFAPLLLPLVILGVPIIDTAWALLRRARDRAGLTIADKGHLHHRLMRLGHGHRRAVLILWGWTGLLSAAVLVPVYTGNGLALVPLGLAAVGLLLYTVLGPAWEARRRAAEAVRADEPQVGAGDPAGFSVGNSDSRGC